MNGGGVRGGGDAVIGGEWPLEDPEHRTGFSAILKYAILALICALAFFIRLFAVVSGWVGSSDTFLYVDRICPSSQIENVVPLLL